MPLVREPTTRSELLRIPLLETVWKVRLISLVGSQESSKGSQEGPFGHLTGHRMRPPEHSSDFPDSLSRETVWKVAVRVGSRYLGSAKRPKWCPFAPLGRLVGS